MIVYENFKTHCIYGIAVYLGIRNHRVCSGQAQGG